MVVYYAPATFNIPRGKNSPVEFKATNICHKLYSDHGNDMRPLTRLMRYHVKALSCQDGTINANTLTHWRIGLVILLAVSDVYYKIQ